MGLSSETNARALQFFRKHVLLAGVWSPEGGASLRTFYVGACLFAFPNVFQRWAGERRRSSPTLPEQRSDEPEQTTWSPTGGNLQLDPAVTVTSALTVANELKAMPSRTRAVAERIVLDGAPYAEIAAELGITERAVEGLLYRYRTEAQRRQLRRRLA
jgi:DNA-directed RNA polymerase specialized sigma24 family protein